MFNCSSSHRKVSLESVPERLVNHAQTYMAKAECVRGRVREALARHSPSNASDVEEKSRMWLNSAVMHLHLDQIEEARMATVHATEAVSRCAGQIFCLRGTPCLYVDPSTGRLGQRPHDAGFADGCAQSLPWR